MNISALATELRGFNVTIVLTHRPYFDWVRSYYYQLRGSLRPPMALEEYVSTERILGAAAGRDQSSVAVYRRYAAHFTHVSMRRMGDGDGRYIADFVCTDVRAAAACRRTGFRPT